MLGTFLKTSIMAFLEQVQNMVKFNEPVESEKLEEFIKSFRLKPQKIPAMEEIFRKFHRKLYEKFPSSLLFPNSLLSEESNKARKKKWSGSDHFILICLVFFYSRRKNLSFLNLSKLDWSFIGHIISKSEIECVFKFNSLLKSQVAKHEWSNPEKELLFQIVNSKRRKGKPFQWVDVAREFYQRSDSLVFRSPNACRGVWMHHLDPQLKKTVWSLEEDINLIDGFLKHEKKWIKIGENLRGRNPDAIKNRFHHICKNFKINCDSETLTQDFENLREFCEKYALPLFKSSSEVQSEASRSTQNDETECLQEVSSNLSISQENCRKAGIQIQQPINYLIPSPNQSTMIQEGRFFRPDFNSRNHSFFNQIFFVSHISMNNCQ